MAGRKLAVSVHLQRDEEAVVYQAGDSPSAEDAKLIDNPDVWADDESDDDGDDQPKRSTRKK